MRSVAQLVNTAGSCRAHYANEHQEVGFLRDHSIVLFENGYKEESFAEDNYFGR
jgi:hypothetical protein